MRKLIPVSAIALVYFLVFGTAMWLLSPPRVWAGSATCYTVVPYTFSVAMWGSQGKAAPGLARNLVPQGPIFGTDAKGNITSAGSWAECNAVRHEVLAALGTARLVTSCHPTTPVVLDGPIQ